MLHLHNIFPGEQLQIPCTLFEIQYIISAHRWCQMRGILVSLNRIYWGSKMRSWPIPQAATRSWQVFWVHTIKTQYRRVIWKYGCLALNCCQVDVCPIHHGHVKARNLWLSKNFQHIWVPWRYQLEELMKGISKGWTMKVCLYYRVKRNINSFLDIRLPTRHGASLNLDTRLLGHYLHCEKPKHVSWTIVMKPLMYSNCVFVGKEAGPTVKLSSAGTLVSSANMTA